MTMKIKSVIKYLTHHICVDSILSDSLQPHGLQPTRLFCPWNFPGKNTRVGCHFLLPRTGRFPCPFLFLMLIYNFADLLNFLTGRAWLKILFQVNFIILKLGKTLVIIALYACMLSHFSWSDCVTVDCSLPGSCVHEILQARILG